MTLIDSDPSSNNTKQLLKRVAFLSSVKYFERDWVNKAACRGEDFDLFFPVMPNTCHNKERDILNQQARATEALKICARCPVLAQCKQDHLHEEQGIFWGTVPAERIRVKGMPWRTCNCISCTYRRARSDHEIRSIGQQRRQSREQIERVFGEERQ